MAICYFKGAKPNFTMKPGVLKFEILGCGPNFPKECLISQNFNEMNFYIFLGAIFFFYI